MRDKIYEFAILVYFIYFVKDAGELLADKSCCSLKETLSEPKWQACFLAQCQANLAVRQLKG